MKRSATRITNYEMQLLRDGQPVPRRTWMRTWCAVSNEFHPTSLEEWQAWIAKQDDES